MLFVPFVAVRPFSAAFYLCLVRLNVFLCLVGPL